MLLTRSVIAFSVILMFFCAPPFSVFLYAGNVDSSAEIIISNAAIARPGSEFRLDEITVTATRGRSSLKDSPASVTVIKKEDMAGVAGPHIEDALQRLPEITLTRTQRTECAAREITLRGVPDQNKTLVLMDGIPLNGPAHGWLSWSLVPKEAVERIEVVRGPMSALYGSGAMGGVINIITKKPQKSKETTVSAGYGSLKTVSGSIYQSGVTDKVAYFAGGSFYNSGGYIAAKTPRAYNTNSGRLDENAIAKFIWTNDDNSTLTLASAHCYENKDRGRAYIDHNYLMNNTYLIYDKELRDRSSIEGTAYWKNQNWNVKFDRRPAYNYLYQTEVHELIDRGASFKKTFASGGRHTLIAGIDYKLSNLTMRDYFHSGAPRLGGGHGDQSLVSVFAQDEIKGGGGRFVLTVGARGDFCRSYNGSSFDTNPVPAAPISNAYPEKSWKSFSPKAGIAYHATKRTTWRASAGKAFAAPNLMKMYTVMQRGTSFVTGNPNLDPETAVSYELGFDHSFGKGLTLRAAAFRTRSDNFISSRNLSPTVTLYDNITKVDIDGVETELDYKINKNWSLAAGYAYSKTVVADDANNAAIIGNDLPFAPRKKMRFGISYAKPGDFTLEVSARHVGDTFTNITNARADALAKYWTTDLVFGKTLKKNRKLSFGVENISNVKYDVYGIPDDRSVAPGRVYTMNFSQTF